MASSGRDLANDATAPVVWHAVGRAEDRHGQKALARSGPSQSSSTFAQHPSVFAMAVKLALVQQRPELAIIVYSPATLFSPTPCDSPPKDK
jgi:hypothetical protein